MGALVHTLITFAHAQLTSYDFDDTCFFFVSFSFAFFFFISSHCCSERPSGTYAASEVDDWREAATRTAGGAATVVATEKMKNGTPQSQNIER